MKNAYTHTTLRKIVFLIESLSSAELLSRTLMELWMDGYEAERIPTEQIMTQLSYFPVLPAHVRAAAASTSPDCNRAVSAPASADCNPAVNAPASPDCNPAVNASTSSVCNPAVNAPASADCNPAVNAPASADCNPAVNTSTSSVCNPAVNAPASADCNPAAHDRHPLAPTHLIVTDRADIAQCCLKYGFAVIGYLHDQNKDASFDGIRYLIEDISGLDAPFCELAFCRAHQLPYPVLETERCLVREITLDDVTRLYEIYADPAITSYIEALYADETAERSYIRDYIDHVYGFYGYGMWIVVNKENGQIIGRAGIEPKEDFAELGYVIAREYQNQGYATEVCRAILFYAADRLGLPEIYVRVQKENAASLRICEKLHFQLVPHAENPDDPNDPDMLLFILGLN